MSLLNASIGRLFDLLLLPFAGLPPLAGLAAASLLTAISMLLVFKATTDQARLRAVKRAIHAGLFEIRLFNHDPAAVFRAQAEILRHNATYLRLSLVPMLWMIVPFVLVAARLDSYYGYRGLPVNEPVLVKAQLREGEEAPGSAPAVWRTRSESHDGAVALDAPEGISVETPAARIPSTGEYIWRVRARVAGEYDLRVRVGDETFTKRVDVSDRIVSRSPVRVERGFVNQLFFPAESPLPPDAPVTLLSVAYPSRRIPVFGYEAHWIVVYLGLSVVFALALRRRFNVAL